jgi:hypothetical protein
VAATVTINRAPVLTLWAAIVAERLGHDEAAALTLGKAVAGMNAQSKARRLGLAERGKEPAGKPRAAKPVARTVELLGRAVPVTTTAAGLRATAKGRAEDPVAVERYLAQKFGDALEEVRAAFRALARSRTPAALEAEGFALYEAFRPAIPAGVRGWGAAGILDLALVRRLAAKKR